MSKEVPPEGNTFNGVFIPRRTKIGYCDWGLFRDREIWGEDVHAFRPERWLDSSAEKNSYYESNYGACIRIRSLAIFGQECCLD